MERRGIGLGSGLEAAKAAFDVGSGPSGALSREREAFSSPSIGRSDGRQVTSGRGVGRAAGVVTGDVLMGFDVITDVASKDAIGACTGKEALSARGKHED